MTLRRCCVLLSGVLSLLVLPWLCGAQLQPELSHPLHRGLLAWWRPVPGLTGGDRWFDLLSGQYHGALTNMGASATSGWSPATQAGGYAQLNFDGTDDYVLVGTDPLFDFLDTTFTLTVEYRLTPGGTSIYLLAKRISAGTSGGWFLRANAAGTLTARVVDTGNGAAAERSTLSTNHRDDTWRQVTVVYTTDSTTIANNDVALYVNGVLDQDVRVSSNSTGNMACACPLTFGALSSLDAGSFVGGSFASVRLWQRRLTEGEIHALARLTLTGEAELFRALPQAFLAPAAALVPAPAGTFLPFFR
jgi:hypothetical protein